MLCFARFGIFRDVGPAIVLALVVAAMASVTVVPAMVAVIGPRTFWPRRHMRLAAGIDGAGAEAAGMPRLARMRDRLWPAVARLVTRRPGLVLLVSLAALAAPGARGLSLTWAYDAQGSLKSTYDAVRGMEMVSRHWSIGEIAPVMALAVAQSPEPAGKWASASANILPLLRGVEGVRDVRCLTRPLGLDANPLTNAAIILLGAERLRGEFISADGRAMWLSAVLKTAPQTPSALADAEQIRTAVEAGLSRANIRAKVHLTGPTAETVDLRTVTQSDFRRTATGALVVIFVIMVVLLRDMILAFFMVAATVISYVATLGLTYWTFQALGQSGLDWEVEVFLFIVMVAVGQDYNIFFAVRVAQEAAKLAPAQAVEQALIHTGRVISSCGVIMAATLGSMMAGDVKMLQQLGFALALGMLMDTFVIRPLFIPCLMVLTGRTLGKSAAFIRASGGWNQAACCSSGARVPARSAR
jgi:RND superfamily putative drug exporter